MVRRYEKVAALTILVLTGVVGLYSYENSPLTPHTSGCDVPSGYILIVADQRGYNDSVHHSRPWPIINVRRGEPVRLFVCNEDPNSAHGFAIDHYLAAGAAIRPGGNFKASFVADQRGNFTMYCNIFCPVHIFMKGELRVSS